MMTVVPNERKIPLSTVKVQNEFEEEGIDTIYEPVAVIVYSIDKTHYTTYVRRQTPNMWYYVDDHRVHKCLTEWPEVQSCASATIVFVRSDQLSSELRQTVPLGLPNVGNACFAISALQVVASVSGWCTYYEDLEKVGSLTPTQKAWANACRVLKQGSTGASRDYDAGAQYVHALCTAYSKLQRCGILYEHFSAMEVLHLAVQEIEPSYSWKFNLKYTVAPCDHVREQRFCVFLLYLRAAAKSRDSVLADWGFQAAKSSACARENRDQDAKRSGGAINDVIDLTWEDPNANVETTDAMYANVGQGLSSSSCSASTISVVGQGKSSSAKPIAEIADILLRLAKGPQPFVEDEVKAQFVAELSKDSCIFTYNDVVAELASREDIPSAILDIIINWKGLLVSEFGSDSY